MSDPASLRRQLKIKSGVATRLLKEHNMYRKEAEDQQRKLDKFVADGAEEWDIKNATRMMEESNKMIKDSSERLGNAVEDLRAIVLSAKKEPALAEDQDLLKAEEALKSGVGLNI
jgi:tubulin-specific chaperone A